MRNAIEVKNVTKIYRKETQGFIEDIKSLIKPKYKIVLDNVSFSVRRGDIFGLLGPNGAGKTTLLKIIMGLLKYDSGEVFVLGEEVPKNYHKIASRINGIFARANLWWELTGKENLEVYGKIYRVKNLDRKINFSVQNLLMK
jgi:ABC-2 type transport system ATP-binding protein